MSLRSTRCGGGWRALSVGGGEEHPDALRRAAACAHAFVAACCVPRVHLKRTRGSSCQRWPGNECSACLVSAPVGNECFVHTHLARPTGVAAQRKSGTGQGPPRYKNYPVPLRTSL